MLYVHGSSHGHDRYKRQFLDSWRSNRQNQVTAKTTYIRWGRNDCPMGAKLVYRGYMSGRDRGSGTNHLCLPEEPIWGAYDDRQNTRRSEIFGTELNYADSEPAKAFPAGSDNRDLTCAVCLVRRSTTLMVPARTQCYRGWQEEYSGYLVGGSKDDVGSEYVCLDSLPDFIPGDYNNDAQSAVEVVEARCGSLPCPPYVNHRELSCVVCSKS